jgi:hypothetical protein
MRRSSVERVHLGINVPNRQPIARAIRSAPHEIPMKQGFEGATNG